MKRIISPLYLYALFLHLALFYSHGIAAESAGSVSLTVYFPGLSSVHTDVRLSDGKAGSFAEDIVSKANWKNNKAQLYVPPGVYDVRVRKGDSSIIVDDVDCNSNCTVENITSKLTINFSGLSSVHSAVKLPDGVTNSVDESEVTHKNWKSDKVEIPVLKGIYDVLIRHGASQLIVDSIDCMQNQCIIDNIVSTLTVNFPKMHSVHTDVWLPGANIDTEEAEVVTYQNWKDDKAVIPVLKGIYDVRVRKGPSRIIVKDVDCLQLSCSVNEITTTLTIDFPKLENVHTDAWNPDSKPGEISGEEVSHNNWQNHQAVLTLLRGNYDIRIRKGPASLVLDDINCQLETCNITDIVSTLTVNFPGIFSVHTDIWLPGANIGDENVEAVTHNNWKDENAVLTVLRGIYDARIRKGESSLIVNDVDCRQSECNITDIVSTLTVKFPGLNNVHTDVWLPDNETQKISERGVTHKNWQKSQAVLNVLKMKYDVRVRKGESSIIIDDVDCTSSSCEVNDIIAKLSIKFPGLTNVHSDARIPDGISGSATGGEVNHSNWKKHETSMVVLRKHYDVRVRHVVTTVFDNVDCTSGVCDVLVMGDAQITLVNGDNNSIIPDKKLIAFEKQTDGNLLEVMRAYTNKEGQAHFTLNGIDEGKTFVIQARNPLDNSKHYYSPFIFESGELLFVVTKDSDTELDLTPPTISITSPLDGTNVSHNGFRIEGNATDNQQLESVILSIDNDSMAVNIDTSSSTWSANISSEMLTVDQALLITATAIDRARNESQASITVTPVMDMQGPIINIASHSADDEVPVTGFLLSGTVTDDTAVQSLSATLIDPQLGTVFENQDVDISSASGKWAIAVQNGQIAENSLLNLALLAIDGDNNQTNLSITLNVVAVDNTGFHMLRRMTFGATPSLLQEMESLGTQAYLNQQLSPTSIDDSELNARIGSMTPNTVEELQQWTLLHMIYSKRQLLEVMTWFWDNHFNTNINAERQDANEMMVNNSVAFELAENNAFRANALGNFRQLLEISAKSPSMLIYLDSISNVVNDSNENYARELLELHTMGVDGGFTHHEVETGSEIFTGWHLQNGAFSFSAAQHNTEAHTFMGNTIPAGGIEQGEQVLDILAAHPSTAHFICKKLSILFVSDTPPQSLINRCATTFQNTVNDSDQIAQVLRVILSSPEFFYPQNDRSKIKTPLEFVVGAIRNLEFNNSATGLAEVISEIGIQLYENDIPTGWSEIGEDWINPSLLIERLKWVNQLARSSDEANTSNTLSQFFSSHGFETSDGVVGFLLELSLGDAYPDIARQQAINLLNGTNGFDMSDPDAEDRLQQLTGAVLSYPQYQFQ